MSRARELSRLGNPNIISADADFNVGFGTLTPRAKVDTVGVVSATSFYGDGSTLTGIAAEGIGTPLSDEKTNPLNQLFYTNQAYTIGVSTTVDAPASGSLGYSQASEIIIADGIDLTIADGDSFMVDVLGITTDPQVGASVDNNYLFSTVYADNITNQAGTGAPDASQGFKISKTTESTNSITGALIVSGGVGIAKSLHVGGNVSVGGTFTYEDVTNQDVLGIATYRSGVKFGVAGVGGTVTAVGNATFAGIVTASSFSGNATSATSASGLTGTPNITVGTVVGSALTVSGITTVTHFDTQGSLVEAFKTQTTAWNSNGNLNISEGNLHYNSTNLGGTGAFLNVISTAGIDTDLATGQALNVTAITSVNATTAFVNALKIDGKGTGITTSWVGGSVPTAGGGSGVDTYSFNILKTGSETYVVIASQTKTS